MSTVITHGIPRARAALADHPQVIQGGMGVAVSDWRLAAAVSLTGQLGVVSGTAVEVVCARRLQDGDPGGHVRRALAAFPLREVSKWILDAYYIAGGKRPQEPYHAVPRFTLRPSRQLQELVVAANFVEVFLARRPGGGPIGINYLRKIEMPLPASVYGALLAGVDHIIMGAGNPCELPALARRLARHEDVSLPVRVQGARSDDGPFEIEFSPSRLVGGGASPLAMPRILAVVASVDLARALAEDPVTRPDGFVVEGPSAGGHNAPPRGPRRVDDLGQPVYDDRDHVDLRDVVAIGLPVWAAGGYGTPAGLRAARQAGAVGVQVGTAFALCEESGLEATVKTRTLDAVRRGTLTSRSDWRCSPTGFPFRVVELEDTLSDTVVRAARPPACDLGMLRSIYLRPDGVVGYRCPAEPIAAYVGKKGGRPANAQGRVCLCNALLSSAGLAQRRRNGYVEPPLVTAGSDVRAVEALLPSDPSTTPTYHARDVVAHLLGDSSQASDEIGTANVIGVS